MHIATTIAEIRFRATAVTAGFSKIGATVPHDFALAQDEAVGTVCVAGSVPKGGAEEMLVAMGGGSSRSVGATGAGGL